jgi:dienelactone hydrolase
MEDRLARTIRFVRRWAALAGVLLLTAACDFGDPGSPQEQPPGDSDEALTQAEVTVQSDSIELPGVIERRGEAADAEPRPGVVIVHGSGPVDRDGEAPTTDRPPVYRRWAETMAEENVVVLRYEKRSTRPEVRQHPLQITFLDFVRDAAAAGRLLREQPDVDPDSIVFLGHSQGAGVALAAATRLQAESGTPAAVASLAGPAFAVDSLLLRQLDANSNASDSLVESVRTQFETLRAEGETADGQIQGASDTFWWQWIRHTQKADSLAARHDGDLLALQGRSDTRYPGAALDRNLSAWRRIARADGSDAQVRVYDDVGHLFPEPSREGSPIRDVLDWIRR